MTEKTVTEEAKKKYPPSMSSERFAQELVKLLDYVSALDVHPGDRCALLVLAGEMATLEGAPPDSKLDQNSKLVAMMAMARKMQLAMGYLSGEPGTGPEVNVAAALARVTGIEVTNEQMAKVAAQVKVEEKEKAEADEKERATTEVK